MEVAHSYCYKLLVKHIQELETLTDSLVPGASHWWVGVGNDQSISDCISDWWVGVGNDRSISDCISGWKSYKQKIAIKESLGLNYTQLIRSHRTARYQKITCVY